MDADAWRRGKELFGEALELPPSQRERFLAEHCEDLELRGHVAKLLLAHESTEPLLATSLLTEEKAEEAPSQEIGSRIGPFRVVALIGRGGMGEVFLAERDDAAFTQRVAIKRIKKGFDSDEVVRRFLHERQILAGLVHPYIARLLEGGATDDGRPYFVLEAIDGRPITVFCREQKLDLPARLRLFLRICEAVEYAHRNLVVHRDLKPANILVTAEGTPKLLDFGIAKLLAPSDSLPEATRLGAQPLTPEYASPEQLAGGAITTATDVYALGLLLYELLVGVNPRTLARRSNRLISRDSLAREMAADAAPFVPMSRAARQLAAKEAGALRQTARLAGDLDAIAARALAYDPEERYAAVSALAADIERHLANRPVLARRPDWSYLLRRAVRRHRVAFGAALALVSLAGLAVFQGSIARHARDDARDAQRNVEGLTGYLTGLFSVASPNQSRGRDVTAQEMLDTGALVLRSNAERGPSWLPPSLLALRAEPSIRAELLHALGAVYRERGELVAARSNLERALVLRRGDSTLVEVGRASTHVQLGHVLREQGHFAASREHFGRALEIRRAVLGGDSSAVAECHDGLGLLEQSEGHLERAADELHQAITLRRSTGEPLALAESLTHLAGVEIDLGRTDAAARLVAEAKGIREKLLGSDHPLIAEDFALLGRVAYEGEHFSEAVGLYGKSLALRRQVLPADHPDLALTLSDLGAAHLALGDLDGAEASLREVVAMDRRLYPQGHPYLADALLNLGATLQSAGRLAEAERELRAALDIERGLVDGDPLRTASVLGRLAVVRRDRGDLEQAEGFAREALDLREKHQPSDHLDVALASASLGNLWVALGRAQAAEPLLARTVAIREAKLLPDDPSVALARSALGACWAELGRLDEARPLLEESHRTLVATLGADHPNAKLAAARLERWRKLTSSGKPTRR